MDAFLFLHEDDLLEFMLQSQSFSGIVLLKNMLIKLVQDSYILHAVLLHLWRPLMPSIWCDLSIVSLMLVQTVAPGFQGMASNKL